MEIASKPYKIGMRSVKTAIAVFVCILLYAILEWISFGTFEVTNPILKVFLFLLNRNDPIYACISSIIATQSTIENSWKKGKNRIIGTFIGGIIGLILLYVDMGFYNRLFSMVMVPVGLLFLIWLCNTINKPSAVSFAAITFVIIMIEVERFDDPAYIYALNRTIDTAIGVFISMVVNLSFGNPKIVNQEETTNA
ncbi:MAG: hypothetical protein EOM05_07410 [Clostridia bacterium]|nr:hypothetical protein [Clostridia bacterium]